MRNRAYAGFYLASQCGGGGGGRAVAERMWDHYIVGRCAGDVRGDLRFYMPTQSLDKERVWLRKKDEALSLASR